MSWNGVPAVCCSKHSVKLRRFLLREDVATCLGTACVLFVVQTDTRISLHNKEHARHSMTCCHIST
jgi:hypothetical protein